MLGKIFKKDKPMVYLGELGVAPTNVLNEQDGWGLLESEDLVAGLKNSLKELIDLPPVQEIQTPEDNDLVLDMMVVKHQGGSFFTASLGYAYSVPLFWRPKVTLKARLYRRKTGKTLHVFTSTKKVAWKQYFSRVFTVSGLFSLKPLFGVRDMEGLLCQAGIDVLQKALKKL